jgi:tetratricopeptide (TPR) repeat protein
VKTTLLILLIAVAPCVAQTAGPISPENLYSKCKESVITILTFDSNRAPLGQGSGFIVGKNRVVTNYHVAAGSSSASVVFSDGSMAPVTAVVAGSGPKDLVLIEAATGNRAALAIGNEVQLKVGETIYAIGTPRGLTSSLSSGLVSAFRQDQGEFLIQITASIAPGSSGGPLLNSRGQVVGVTSSRLKDGSFGFAVGAGDLQQLLKVPLAVKVQLSDLNSDENDAPVTGLESVQSLYEAKKYEEAEASFNSLPDQAKTGFDGQLLLCKIEHDKKAYKDAIQACALAERAKPGSSEPYGLEALSMLMLGDTEHAESMASKAADLSSDGSYKKLLGIIHYSEEKYGAIPNDLPVDSNDTFVLSMLAGAALHNKDYDSFRRLTARINTLKPDNGWQSFTNGLAAERELNWDIAVEDFKKCDRDGDFVDPICSVNAMQVEIRRVNYAAAKTDLDKLLSDYPTNHNVLVEGIFLELLLENPTEADRLHEALRSTAQGSDNSSDCLYYYARNQSKLAGSYCEAAIRENGTTYGAWSNAGYVALDNLDFSSALSYFGKAFQLFYSSKEKHTVTQELDLSWGLVLARYYSGDEKGAKSLFHVIKKTYPQFLTSSALKQLPLVWSSPTIRLVDGFTAKVR